MTNKKTDVLVIGGGPAGTTFATFMQRNGTNVTLLEKEHHPRFHIGESLLPMNLPILERLGVLDKIRSIGVPKLGADFTIGNSGAAERIFYFRDALGASPPHAFEVRRSEFDRVLFDNSRQSGVTAIEGMKVTRVVPLADGKHEVNAIDEQGEEHRWVTRYLVDASGRDTFLSRANGWRIGNSKHASAAVFGHFRGVTRRPGDDQGNISLYWFEHGWIWMIPLRDDIMSIGAVCRPEFLRTRTGTLDEFLLEILESLSETAERMKSATTEMPAQATGNYSYFSDRMSGPGYLMAGDAFAFIDPVFSSGVYLAMNGAERGVEVAEAWFSGSRWNYALARYRFEKDTRRGIATFSWFIYRFTSPAMSYLMSDPRNALQVVQAVISMLAGDVYSNRSVRQRLLVFKTIYNVSLMLNWREWLADRRLRLASVRAASEANG
ncbi:MAG: tryptophan 7-halogenase [Proteobacteria bacterium]|nr:tryptophan 7-halogenase [Pseudomonadota bacterium]